MEARRLNQTELAKELGLPGTSSVSRWLQFGARPEPMVCEQIAERFGADVVAVLRLAGHLRSIPAAESDAMGELGADYQYREIDPRVIALARTLDPRMLDLWLEFGEVMARAGATP